MYLINLLSKYSSNRKSGLILLLLTAVCIPVSLPAEDPVSLRVGIYQNEPKIFLNEAGEPAGIYVELLNEIARKEGWHLDYVHGSWAECLERLKGGEIDILPDMAFSLERAREYSFNAIPVLESWSQVYALPNQHINRLFDLENKRVTLLKGSVQEKEFQELMTGFGLHYTHIALATFEEAFDWVKKDLADVVIANNFFGESHYAQFDLEKTPVILSPASLHFGLYPMLDSSILPTLDAYLSLWKTSPHSVYYQSISTWLMPSPPSIRQHNHHPFLLIIALLASVLAITLVMLLRSYRQRRDSQLTSRQQLQEEVSKFRGYIEHAPVGVFVVNEQGRFVEVNLKACESTGYDAAELLQKEITELLSEESRVEGIKHFQRVVTEGKARGIYVFKTKHLGKRYFSVNAVRITNKRFLGFVSDVSDRIILDEERQQHKEQLRLEVEEKTRELTLRIAELEQFQEATIERELRMEELRKENERLSAENERLRQEG